jgi:hypothetical protein
MLALENRYLIAVGVKHRYFGNPKRSRATLTTLSLTLC